MYENFTNIWQIKIDFSNYHMFISAEYSNKIRFRSPSLLRFRQFIKTIDISLIHYTRVASIGEISPVLAILVEV